MVKETKLGYVTSDGVWECDEQNVLSRREQIVFAWTMRVI